MPPAASARLLRPLGLLVGLAAVVASLLLSILVGAADVRPRVVLDAIVAFDGSFQHLVIRTVRLPRVLAGMLVGAALAVAGALMQGLTRNPLAAPGVLGVNAGASLAVVLGVVLLGGPPLASYAWFAFAGAAFAAVFVYALASAGRGGPTPLKLTLAGAVFAAFAASFTSAILIMDARALDQVRLWTAGSLAGRDLGLLAATAPYILLGLLGALLIAPQMTTLSLGEEVAAGLGQRTGRLRATATVLVVLLAGGSVALAGPVGFVGLVVPHLVRFLVGADYRWVVPYGVLGGAVLVTLADVGARWIIRPQELPVGVIMALVGAPFFLYLARTRVRR